LWPIVFPLVFAFIPRIARAGLAVLIVSAVLGIIIGITEEVLWRGVDVNLFGERVWLTSIYPAAAFGLWHLCPLSVLPSRYPGGVVSFAAYSMVLGLSYAYCARRARAIFWCAASHSVHDALGLGGCAYIGCVR
jgi:membrane protease YdiL (CAAX protease family)